MEKMDTTQEAHGASGGVIHRGWELEAQQNLGIKIEGCEKNYKCTICGELFSSKGNSKRHKRILHTTSGYKESNFFSCNLCDKNFSRGDNLMRHMLVHESAHSDQLKCEVCNTTFKRKDNYKRHVKSIFEKDETFKNKCSECKKVFCTGKLLTRHYNAIHRKFACENCAQTFTLKSSLELHIETRNNSPCNECDILFCNKYFLGKHHNEVHMWIKCDICGELLQKTGVTYHKLWAHTK